VHGRARLALAIRQRTQPDDWTTFEAKSILGEALLDQNRYADAEPLPLSGYKGMKHRESKFPSQARVRLTQAIARLVQFYECWSKMDKAEQWREELEAASAAKQPLVVGPSKF
jgi:hypothetical protein